eukprot:9809402-Lingulodinium_polyedra.AAC.1
MVSIASSSYQCKPKPQSDQGAAANTARGNASKATSTTHRASPSHRATEGQRRHRGATRPSQTSQ